MAELKREEPEHWKAIAMAILHEKDHQKMIDLARQLTEALDRQVPALRTEGNSQR